MLGKDSALLHSVRERGYLVPSEIQKKSIPEILNGKDVIAGASTGSGKTLAFAAGLVHNVKKDFGIQGLVLTPTRELAEQITNELLDFSKKKDLDVISVYGGVSINDQIRRLPRADIVVGTPGRILDHIDRNSIDLSRINTLVLDEADRMLDMGFRDDVERIIMRCSKKRQTLLFSATISDDIVHLAKRYMHDAVEISAESQVDPSKMEQVYYDVEDGLKYSLLKYLLEHENSKLAMVFCNTRRNVDFVANNLQAEGIEALPIHGGFSQEKRNKILENFHSKKIKVLIATDVAARGLDIDGVTHIYNYDTPPTKKEYVHRIGRTARAGNKGKVINIIASRDYENFHNLMTGEFNIVLMETPFIEKARIKWIPQGRSMGRDRDSKFGSRGRSGGFGGRENNRSSGRSPSRGYGGRNSRRDDRRDDRRVRHGRFSNRNGNNHRRF